MVSVRPRGARRVHETIDLLAGKAPDLPAALPTVRRRGAVLVVDGTLICCDRLAVDQPLYSGKHRCHGVNMQAITDGKGNLLWISPAMCGAIHGTAAVCIWLIPQHRRAASLVALGDQGYTGLDPDTVLTPYKGRDKPEPKRAYNRAHTKLRAPGERAFAQLKKWRILRKLRCATLIARAIHTLNTYEQKQDEKGSLMSSLKSRVELSEYGEEGFVTRYGIDLQRQVLTVSWETGGGDVAATIAELPSELDEQTSLGLAHRLTFLSKCLWRCYTHPASAAMDDMAPNSEGWRRQHSRDAFGEVLAAVRAPNLPTENGVMTVCYDPVEESAHRIGRALHHIEDSRFTQAVIRDVQIELDAVSAAELGNLTGRAHQAVTLSRADASPVQIEAADRLLHGHPFGHGALFTEVDPTAAAVAGAHWLFSAAEVAAKASGVRVTAAVAEADNITALPVGTCTKVLDEIDKGRSVQAVVVEMVAQAMDIADGKATPATLEKATGGNIESPSDVQLTFLDPHRPALDLLEDLMSGIYGCAALYREVNYDRYLSDDDDEDCEEDDSEAEDARIEEELNDEFCQVVRDRAVQGRSRLHGIG